MVMVGNLQMYSGFLTLSLGGINEIKVSIGIRAFILPERSNS